MTRNAMLVRVVGATAVAAALTFGAKTALANESVTSCWNPPHTVGSCSTPGFNCQDECDTWNEPGTTSGQCAATPENCCSCLQR